MCPSFGEGHDFGHALTLTDVVGAQSSPWEDERPCKGAT